MKYIFLILVLISQQAASLNRQGPDYYEFLQESKITDKQETTVPAVSSTDVMQQLTKIHTEALNTSILNPTAQNILRERMLAIVYMDLAQRYQERAQMVVNENPNINYLLKHPADDAAQKLQESIDDGNVRKRISELTKTHGLFFFFAGNCHHCKAFAPTIKRFAQRFGFEIIPISLDGSNLPEFPNSKKNNGQAEKLGVKTLPAVFAIDPKNGAAQSILLSYGNVSVKELTDKLDYNYRYLTGQVKYELLN